MSLDGKTILITGSTDGVGRRVAERLADMGAEVLIHGRNIERGARRVDAIKTGGRGKAEFHPADFTSLTEVRRLADRVRNDHTHLDVLINNAGIGSGGPGRSRQVSADGYELRFAVNYLSGFLLTMLLLPLMRANASARIVNVASAGQSAIDFDDVMLTHGYSGGRAYTQSKLAQILFTFDLATALKDSGITVNCLHPATYMDTTMVRQAGTTPISSVEDGAAAILNLAIAPELEGRSGLYFNRLHDFNRLHEARANPQAYDEDARAKLRALSLHLTGLPATAWP